MLDFIPLINNGKNVDPKPAQKFERPEALILEALQNSVDGTKTGEIPKIHFHFSRVNKSDCAFLGSNFQKHLKASKYSMEKNLPENIECLVIEDFGTTGIEGNHREVHLEKTTEGIENSWYYFLNDFGGESKLTSSGKGGSEGEGRQTFMLSSKISTFFGISIDHKKKIPAIFGMSYFGSHKVDAQRFNIFCDFGEKNKAEENVIPIVDEKKVREFIKLFGLKRKIDDAGLSVIIPIYNSNEITKEFIEKKIIEIYRVPLLRNKLSVYINDKEINYKNIETLADQNCDETSKKFMLSGYFQFLNSVENVSQENRFVINFDNQKKISKDQFSNFEDLVTKFNKDELIEIQINFSIFKKDKNTNRSQYPDKSIGSHVKYFIKKYPSDENSRDEYNDVIRGYMPLYKMRNKKTSMYNLLDVQDEEAMLLFKHAEQANHSSISVTNKKLELHYTHYKNFITYVKNLHKIYEQIIEEDTDDDHETTQDLFGIENESDDGRKNSGDDEGEGDDGSETGTKPIEIHTPLIVPPIFEGLKKFSQGYSINENGLVNIELNGEHYTKELITTKIEDAEEFLEKVKKLDHSQYKDKSERKSLQLTLNKAKTIQTRLEEYKEFLEDGCTFYPRRIVIDAAYDSENNSDRKDIKSHKRDDFDFSNEKEFTMKISGKATITMRDSNKIEIVSHDSKFKFQLSGFKSGIEDVRIKAKSYRV